MFPIFSRTGNPTVKTVFLRGQQKLTKNPSTDFILLATIVKIVAEQPNIDAQEAQYTTKTTTPVATEGDEENKQNPEFSLVYILALFLSRFQCAFFQRSLRQRRDALKSLLLTRRHTWPSGTKAWQFNCQRSYVQRSKAAKQACLGDVDRLVVMQEAFTSKLSDNIVNCCNIVNEKCYNTVTQNFGDVQP